MVGVAATTAVVAGTAGAVRHAQDQKYANQAAAQQAPQEYETAPAGDDINTQLQQLAQMHNAGVLTDDEFAKAKAKLLGS
jgi:membrane protease subunit (stomatin/prohibitin family)